MGWFFFCVPLVRSSSVEGKFVFIPLLTIQNEREREWLFIFDLKNWQEEMVEYASSIFYCH